MGRVNARLVGSAQGAAGRLRQRVVKPSAFPTSPDPSSTEAGGALRIRIGGEAAVAASGQLFL